MAVPLLHQNAAKKAGSQNKTNAFRSLAASLKSCQLIYVGLFLCLPLF